MSINHVALRRHYDAALRDRNPGVFFEDLRQAMAKKELLPSDFRIRHLFEQFVPDGREILESYDPQQAGGATLFEATADVVNTSAFANISGQIVFNAMLAAYQSEEFVFSRLVQDVQTSFNGEKIPGITGLGDASAEVKEGEPYPHVGVGEDWIETPQTAKRGLIVPITKEALFFDRTGMLVDRASKVGEAIGLKKEKRLINAFIDENETTYRYKWKGTAYATYQTSTPWINSKTSNALLDYTSLDAVEQLANNLTDPHTGEPIVMNLRHLVVTKQLEMSAYRILNATDVDYASTGAPTNAASSVMKGPNPMKGKYQVVTSRFIAPLLATDTNWFLADIGEVLKYMVNFPLKTEQAPPNSQLEFERDIVLQFKGSERGTPAVVEPRKSIKSAA